MAPDSLTVATPIRDLPADDELWIDFHQLQPVIDKVVQDIEQYVDQKRQARRCGST